VGHQRIISWGTVSHAIKIGRFKVVEPDKAQHLIDCAYEIQAYLDPKLLKSRLFMSALMKVKEIVSLDELVKRVIKEKFLLRRHISMRPHVEQLEQAYNKGQKQKVSFF